MKPSVQRRRPRDLSHSRGLAVSAFTLPEMMVSMAIFVILVSGMVSTNLFGLRMFQVEQTKLNASDEARNIVGKLVDEVRSCDTFQIGTVSTNGTFTGLIPGVPQIGSALIVYPTTNTTNFIVYYVNTTDQRFRRATSVRNSTRVLAQSVTNSASLFQAQDYLGNVVSNNQANTALHLKLEFYQAARFGVPPDYYKLETSATRR